MALRPLRWATGWEPVIVVINPQVRVVENRLHSGGPTELNAEPLTGRDPAAEGGGVTRLSPDPREPFNGAATLRPRKDG